MKPLFTLSIKDIVGIAVAAFFCTSAHAANTLYTDPFDPDAVDIKGPFANDCTDRDIPCKTIGHTLDKSAAGDTIKLAGGMYTEKDLMVSKALVIEAEDPNNVPTFDAQGAGRHFNISPQEGDVVVMRDLKLINGSVTDPLEGGGSIRVTSGIFELWNSTAGYNDTAARGGAIACQDYCEGLQIVGSMFDTNSAAYDGGAISTIAETWVQSSIFRSNSSDLGGGGAIYTDALQVEPANMTIIDSQFTANTGKLGGALYSEYSETEVKQSSFTDNTSESSGSAIYFFGLDKPLYMVNSTISGNVAGLGGTGAGAVHIGSSEAYWGNLSFVDNESVDDGRHVNAFNSTIEVSNSFFYTSRQGLTDACISNEQFVGTDNLWEGPTNGCFDPNSYIADLTDDSLSPLRTHSQYINDYSGNTYSFLLKDGSNAIDLSNNCFDPKTNAQLMIDQRGASRGLTCDVGATERSFEIDLDLDLDVPN